MNPQTWEEYEIMALHAPDALRKKLDAQEARRAVEWLESRPLVPPHTEYGTPIDTTRRMFELYDDHASAKGTWRSLGEGKVIDHLGRLGEREGAWVESERRMAVESYFDCPTCRLAAMEGHDFIVIEPEMGKT